MTLGPGSRLTPTFIIEPEYDDGVPEYEVDFHHGEWEYEYEIHAETGEILHSDKDQDD